MDLGVSHHVIGLGGLVRIVLLPNWGGEDNDFVVWLKMELT